jgi:uncharacterized protein DUF6602
MSARTFDDLLAHAEDELWLGFHRAGVQKHSASKGRTREDAIAAFLAGRLPDRFGVTTGEAIDAREHRTGQLDVVIFDRNTTAPLLAESSGDLLPSEGLLAVVEVKSILTLDELRTCARAAKALSELEPDGKPFLLPRTDGAPADDGRYRCQYSVIAFRSNLGETDWAEKEWRRLLKATTEEQVAVEHIDRVLVLDRGMLVPPSATARTAEAEGKGMLREWFLHLHNFLIREAARRPEYDLQRYGRRRRAPGWRRLLD